MLSMLLTTAAIAAAPPLSVIVSGAPQESARTQASLGFVSKRFKFEWDRVIPMDISVDDLTVKTIFFNKRGVARGPLKNATFGTRAQVEVTNASTRSKNCGFAVAVFDGQGGLLGVASGGNKLGVVKPGKTKSFDLNFYQVKERLQRGNHFIISVELVD